MSYHYDPKYLPAIRWSILRTVRVGGHLGATETMVKHVIDAEFIGVTQDVLRDELHYLEKRELITLDRHELDPWRAELTRYGYDVADYQVDCLPGIARPRRLQG